MWLKMDICLYYVQYNTLEYWTETLPLSLLFHKPMIVILTKWKTPTKPCRSHCNDKVTERNKLILLHFFFLRNKEEFLKFQRLIRINLNFFVYFHLVYYVLVLWVGCLAVVCFTQEVVCCCSLNYLKKTMP